MTYEILGPLRPAVTAGRDRIVLAMLLLHPDRVVSVAECLADTDPEQARRLWLVALAAFREMGVPEQYTVERRLAA